MDIALKQRLVGASVLVALGVIFIPMMLDGPAGNGAHESGRIPDPPDRRFESRMLPVDASQSTSQPQPGNDPVNHSGNGLDSDSGDRPDAIPETVVTSSRPLPVTRVEPAPESTTAGTNSRDEPVPTTPPVEVASASPSGDWVVQLGSFGNAANAARLVERLNDAGHSGYQEKIAVGDKTLYRVRVGFWGSKSAAAIAGRSIGRQMGDVDPSVRKLDSAPSATLSLQGWMVQVGSFSGQTNALALRDRLRAGGFEALVESISGSTGLSYRVRVGPSIDRRTAESMQQRIREEMGLSGIVVSHP